MNNKKIGGDRDIPLKDGQVDFDDVWEAVKYLNMSIMARGGGDEQYSKPCFSIFPLKTKSCIRVRGEVHIKEE